MVPSRGGFSPDNMQFWLSAIMPARLTAYQAAKVLGFEEHQIPVLVANRMLKPLGKPVSNAYKYFAASEIEILARDAAWLSKATQIIYDYWHGKKKRKSANASPPNAQDPESVTLSE